MMTWRIGGIDGRFYARVEWMATIYWITKEMAIINLLCKLFTYSIFLKSVQT